MVHRGYAYVFCILLADGCSSRQPDQLIPVPAADGYCVGTWNIEHLNDGHDRGFPEYYEGGPLYGPRSESDYAALARVISRDLDAVILVLNEVNAQPGTINAWGGLASVELNRLRYHLGAQYAYVVSASGEDQHVAILWDQRRASLDTVFEVAYPETLVDGQDLFLRDPLVARFRLLRDGAARNDLVIVGLHLASGRANDRNHDSAMLLLIDTLTALLNSPGSALAGERDIILAGDLNFDFFDSDREEFVEAMEEGDWDILADRYYPPTRLGGVPLKPESRLDYLICTDAMRGARGLVSASAATVHHDLAAGDYESFRRAVSDHFPVTLILLPAGDDD